MFKEKHILLLFLFALIKLRIAIVLWVGEGIFWQYGFLKFQYQNFRVSCFNLMLSIVKLLLNLDSMQNFRSKIIKRIAS